MGPRRERTGSVGGEEWDVADIMSQPSESSSAKPPPVPKPIPTVEPIRVSLGMLVITVGAPKTQGMIVKFVTTAKGFEAVGVIEAAHRKGRGGGAWMPVSYVEKRLARLPSQDGTPQNTLANVPAMQALLRQLVDTGKDLEEEDFEPLIRLAEQGDNNLVEESRGGKEKEITTGLPTTQEPVLNSRCNLRLSSEEDSNVEVEMLTLRVKELKAALKAATRENPNWRKDGSDDDDELDQVRTAPYGKLQCPCPFSDDRSTMNPIQRASVNQYTRMQYRLFLGEIYSEHRSATEAVSYFFKIFGLEQRNRTSEECCLELHAKILDQFLLDGNGGSWSLWSESGIDLLVKGFLELIVRVNPDRMVPLINDQRLNSRLKKMSFGHNRTYGAVRPKQSRNNFQNSNQNFSYGQGFQRNDQRDNRNENRENKKNDAGNFRPIIPVIQQSR